MLDLKSFVKQSSIYTLSTFLSRAITLLLVPLYVRVLSPEDYGIVDILTITCTLINLTIALEIHQAIARFYNDWTESERPFYVSTAFWFNIIVYTGFVALMYPFRETMAGFFIENKTRTGEIDAALLMAWTSGIYYFTQSQLRWQMKASLHAITSVSFTIVTTLTTVLLVLVLDFKVLGVLYGLVAGNLFASALAIYFARDSYRFSFSVTRLFEMVRFSSPLVFSSISVFFSLYVDRILIKQMLNLTELGLFSIGQKFASVVGLFLSGVNNAITPLIYTHYKKEDTPKQIEKIFRLFLLGALVLFLGAGLFSKEVLIIFTNEQYYGAAPIIPVLILTTLLSSVYNFTPGLFIQNKTKIISLINIGVAIVNFILNWFLIPVWGIMGACISTLIGYTFSFMVYVYFNQKYYPINFYWGKYALSIITVLFVLVVVYLLGLPLTVGSVSLKVVLMILITFVIIFALFEKSDINSLTTKLRSLIHRK
jgi:O-antigen/teichoic acid export membrane protein